MKILYIYQDYFGRRKLYGKCLERCGHKVIYIEKKHKTVKNQIKIEEIKKYNVDLIWFLTPYYVKYNPIVMDYIKSKKIPITFYHGVGGRFPYTDWINVWKQFTIAFPVAYDLHEYFINNKICSYYIPFGFHPNQYFKCINNKKYDVGFAGTIDKKANSKEDNRCIYLNSLKEYKRIVAFGTSFKNKLDKRIIIKKCKSHKEQKEAYSITKINLELPFFSCPCSFMKDKYHFRNRFFEIPATGNFLLSLRTKEFMEIFDEDTIGYYDNNIESFKESVNYYLKNKQLRKEMSKKAYKLVYQKHTFLHRFKQMSQILQKNL
jgi:spore maturation protein CgeB